MQFGKVLDGLIGTVHGGTLALLLDDFLVHAYESVGIPLAVHLRPIGTSIFVPTSIGTLQRKLPIFRLLYETIHRRRELEEIRHFMKYYGCCLSYPAKELEAMKRGDGKKSARMTVPYSMTGSSKKCYRSQTTVVALVVKTKLHPIVEDGCLDLALSTARFFPNVDTVEVHLLAGAAFELTSFV